MLSNGPVFTKRLTCLHRSGMKAFVAEIQKLARDSYQPTLVLDLSELPGIGSDVIELLLRCVELIHHADGRVLLTGVPPEAAVLLEVTRLNTVADVFPLGEHSTTYLPEHRASMGGQHAV